MSRYSAWSVFWNGLIGQKGWDRVWRDPEPKAEYDVVIVGQDFTVWRPRIIWPKTMV